MELLRRQATPLRKKCEKFTVVFRVLKRKPAMKMEGRAASAFRVEAPTSQRRNGVPVLK